MQNKVSSLTSIYSLVFPLRYKYIKQNPSFLFQKLALPLLSLLERENIKFNHFIFCWQINHPNHFSFPSKLSPNASHPEFRTSHYYTPTNIVKVKQLLPLITPKHMNLLQSYRMNYLSPNKWSFQAGSSTWNIFYVYILKFHTSPTPVKTHLKSTLHPTRLSEILPTNLLIPNWSCWIICSAIQ